MKPNLSNYFVPLFVGMMGVVVLLGDPSEKISTRMPIVTGEYQHVIAVGFFVVACVLAVVARRLEKKIKKDK